MQKLRWNIIILTILLISIGVLFLYSASGIYSEMIYNDSYYFVRKQFFFIFIGFIFSLIFFKLNLKKISSRSKEVVLFSLAILILVLFFGVRVGGAKRWFGIFGFGIQPVEFIKIGFIFYLADFLARKKFNYRNFKLICLPVYLTTGAFMMLLLLQPDFGSAIFIGLVSVSMLFFAGIPSKFLFFTALGAVPFVSFALWKFEYMRMRLLGFLSPWEHHKGIGFQLVQSFIAIGSGRFFGQGLGFSKQKLFYLPQAHNDFIFSIIAEELGFLGASLLLLLYVIIIWNFIKMLSKINGLFEKLFLTGLILSFAYQVVINLCVCLGLLPTKGLPLPFISYGGSSLIANMIIIALVLNISKDTNDLN